MRQERASWSWALVALLGGLYVLLSLAVHFRLLTQFDLACTLFLQQYIPRLADVPFSAFSLLGSAEVTGLVLLAYALLFCPPRTRVQLIVLFAALVLVEWAGKNIIAQPGPPHFLKRYALGFGFPTSGLRTPFSYPSGHAARAVFLFFVLSAWLRSSLLGTTTKQILLGTLVVGEVVMLVSRAYLAEHWTTDVIGGTLLAAALALPWVYSTEAQMRRAEPSALAEGAGE